MSQHKHTQPPVPEAWAPGCDVLYNPWMSNRASGLMGVETEFILRGVAPGLTRSLQASQTTVQESSGNQLGAAQGAQSPVEKKVGGLVRFSDVTRHG